MDAVTAAVALMGQQMAVQRLNAAVGIVKSSVEAEQGIVDLISGSAGAGAVYSDSGSVQVQEAGQELDLTA